MTDDVVDYTQVDDSAMVAFKPEITTMRVSDVGPNEANIEGLDEDDELDTTDRVATDTAGESPFSSATAVSAVDMSEIHGKTICYRQLKATIPKRRDFLDQAAYAAIDSLLSQKEPVEFLPTGITEQNLPPVGGGAWKYAILANGILRDGRRAVVVLRGATPFFEVQLPITRYKAPNGEPLFLMPTGEGATQLQFVTAIETALAAATERYNNQEDLFPETTALWEERALIIREHALPAEDRSKFQQYETVLLPTRTEVIRSKPFVHYQEEKSVFLRLYYDKLKPRKIALLWLRRRGFLTASDDLSNYHFVVCRNEMTTLSTWTTVTNYSRVAMMNINCNTVLSTTVRNFRPYGTDAALASNNQQPIAKDINLPDDMMHDKTIVCCWDIETYSPAKRFPNYRKKLDRITTVGMTFHRVTEPEPILRVALCELPADPCPNALTIVCGREANIIRAFAQLLRLMRPEFITGFNDSGYDWPWMIHRARRYKLTAYLCDQASTILPIHNFNRAKYKFDGRAAGRLYKYKLIKLEANQSAHGYSLFCNGMLPIDVCTIYRKMFPKSKSAKLTHFCKQMQISDKADMAYSRMFMIYEKMKMISLHPSVTWRDDGSMCKFLVARVEKYVSMVEGTFLDARAGARPPSTIARMNTHTGKLTYSSELRAPLWDEYRSCMRDNRDVNAYCYRDSELCNQLLCARSVVIDRREVAKTSFCSVYAAFYLANGAKVRNITIAYGQRSPFNIRFSNVIVKRDASGKYSGAYVFPPEKGLQTSKLSIEECYYRQLMLAGRGDEVVSRATTQGRAMCEAEAGPGEAVAVGEDADALGVDGVDGEDEDEDEDDVSADSDADVSDADSDADMQAGDVRQIDPALAKRLGMAASTYAHDPDTHDSIAASWLATTPAKRDFLRSVVAKYGAHIDSAARIREIELELGRPLPLCFHQFWRKRTGRPITGLDFSSLYPSIIRTLNLSPELFVHSKRMADRLTAAGKTLKKIEFEHAGVQHKSWFIWHNGHTDVTQPDFAFGIYPYILDMLFHQRKKVKKRLHPHEDLLEEMDNMSAAELADPDTHAKYINCKLQVGYFNAKQMALKVFMNTFYGEAGTRHSPFFVLDIVCAITGFGQESLRRAQRKVEELDCHVYYGDTDSIYLSVPDADFESIDRAYYSGQIAKMAYWTALVEQTWVSIVPINEHVNAMFIKLTGTRYMNMAYEEVLFPVFFISKKKYFAVEHKKIVNFWAYHLFSRGLEINKRNASALSMITFGELMWELMSADLLATPLELVRSKIRDIYERSWDTKLFLKNYNYNPERRNVTVLLFVERMKEVGIAMPPNERFDALICAKPRQVDWAGRMITMKVGTKMELMETVLKQGLTIDLDYYIKREITAQFGRIIETAPMFAEIAASDSEEDRKVAEDRSYASAKAYIDVYRNRYAVGYHDLAPVEKKLVALGTSFLARSYELRGRSDMFRIMKDGSARKVAKDSGFVDSMYTSARKQVVKEEARYGKWYVDRELVGRSKGDAAARLIELQDEFYARREGCTPFVQHFKVFEQELRIVLDQRVTALATDRTSMQAAHQADVHEMALTLKYIVPGIDESLTGRVNNPHKIDAKLIDLALTDGDNDRLQKYADALCSRVLARGDCETFADGLIAMRAGLVEALRMPIRCYGIADQLRKMRGSNLRVLDSDVRAQVMSAAVDGEFEAAMAALNL